MTTTSGARTMRADELTTNHIGGYLLAIEGAAFDRPRLIEGLDTNAQPYGDGVSYIIASVWMGERIAAIILDRELRVFVRSERDEPKSDRQTKWTLSSDAERAGLDVTRCGIKCSGCGTELATEGDFARHFTVPDARYRNLGDCPKSRRRIDS